MLQDITTDHIYKATEEIDRDGVTNWHRGIVKYEVEINEKSYSPKYVLSIAHKYTEYGTELDSNDFNSTEANNYLKELGFSIRVKSTIEDTSEALSNSSSFTWVPFYEEMCPKIGSYSPAQLIDFLKQLNMDGLTDKDQDGNEFELTDIDPFTFLCFLNKFGDAKRVQILGKVRELMNLSTPAPTDVTGLPNAQAQRVWLFGYQYKRKPDDIDQLRALYHQIHNGTITPEQFDHVLTIYAVGRAKLTEAMFYQQPRQFLPINSKTKPYLKQQGLPIHYENYQDYIHILNLVREKDNRAFFQISADYSQAASEEAVTKYYCVGVTVGSDHSQLERFIQDEVWQSGHEAENEQYAKIVQSIPIGAKLAAKSTYTRGSNHDKKSILQIKNIGTVVSNPSDGLRLNVEWQEDFEPFELVGKGYYQSTIQEVKKQEDIQAIFQHVYEQDMPTSIIKKHPNNIILYGPPGTGKTYGTIDLATDIVDGRNNPDHAINKQRFNQLLATQIEFITFHQNYTYEDFVMGVKPDLDTVNDSLKFKRHEGIFYKIAKRARLNFESFYNSVQETVLRPFEDVFAEFIQPLEIEGKEIEVKTVSNKPFYLTDINDRNIEFRKSGGGTDHSLSLATLKRIYENEEQPIGLRSYYLPIIQLLKSSQPNSTKAKEGLQNYVLIIDEINRANMSRVFGELITLLEDDKRLGGENEIKVTLPSGEEFAVPPNLYIVGTMNTADKSLALLDIALRRRFEFIGKYPAYDIPGMDADVAGMLKKLNDRIYNQKHSADYLIGHAYFIGKRKGNLKPVFQNRVIPLLMEYFGGRTDLVISILADAGIATTKNENTYQLEVADDL